MMRKLLMLALMPVVLTGCIGGKNAPDATLVADAPALVIPPNFELRPPRTDENGVAMPQSTSEESRELRREAQNILVGGEASPKPSSQLQQANDTWLIQKAGGERRNVSIRELMQREQQTSVLKAKEKESKGWFSRTFGGSSDDVDAVDTAELEESNLQ